MKEKLQKHSAYANLKLLFNEATDFEKETFLKDPVQCLQRIKQLDRVIKQLNDQLDALTPTIHYHQLFLWDGSYHEQDHRQFDIAHVNKRHAIRSQISKTQQQRDELMNQANLFATRHTEKTTDEVHSGIEMTNRFRMQQML